MKSSSLFQDKLHQYLKKERCPNIGKLKLPPFLLFSLGVTSILSFFFFLFSQNTHPFKFTLHQHDHHHDLDHHNNVLIQPHNGEENCDLFNGHWVFDINGSSVYTNSSCKTIPSSKNCLKHGREDRDFLNWRWKPHECELPMFQPKSFLKMVQGKKLAFIGDSVARNQMESLLCLLSQEETPRDVYKDSEDRFRTWYFPNHDFTLMTFWTKYLITSEERVINGSSSGVYDLHLDKIDYKWASKLPEIDYAIISDAHWFFRKLYIYEGNNLTGCVYCSEPNVTDLGLSYALKMAFRGALSYINNCKDCKDMVTLLRTYSPAHFENGTWNSGGNCKRTRPKSEAEIDLGALEWELRGIQVEEVERAREEGKKKKRGKRRFRVLDITRAMLMRPDGHPGSHWDNQWMKGFNDCVHWCLPGPVDVWNDLLLAVLRKEAGLSLD